LQIILKNTIQIPDIPLELKKSLCLNLTIQNPKWVENNRQGRWNKGVPEKLEFFAETPEKLTIPRGYMRQLINGCHKYNIAFQIEDKRALLGEVDFSFKGQLKPFQQNACDDVLKKHFGVLTAPTGAGKTVMMLYVIAMRKQPALIVVHTKDLANQWVSRIEEFLGIPEDEIGIIGGGKFKIGEKITVAMVQTLYKKTKEVTPFIGNVIIDECHRTPSRTFTEAIMEFDSYYMTGLSATPFRRDRLSKLIFWHLGDVAHQIEKEHLVESGDILKAEVFFKKTDFNSSLDPTMYYSKVMSELIEDNGRNTLIAADIAKESTETDGVCLVLSDRKAHCHRIASILKIDHNIEADILTGDLSSSERLEVLTRLENNQIRILIATSQLLGEGFDSKFLATLFLIYPIKFSGRLLQYLGRILRPGASQKKARVFDYIDHNIGVLEAAAKSRLYVYNKENIINYSDIQQIT